MPSRKVRRRNHRKVWIMQINAGAREHETKYSHLISGLQNSNMELDRKILAGLAANEPYSFKSVIDVVRDSYTEGGVFDPTRVGNTQ